MEHRRPSGQGTGRRRFVPEPAWRLVQIATLVATGMAASTAALMAADPSPLPSAAPAGVAATDSGVDDASSGPGILGAGVEDYLEPFDGTPDWIDLGSDETGETRLEDGALFMSVTGADVNYRDWYDLAEPVAVVRVEAVVDIDERASTAAGVACGSALGLPRWFIAGVNNADEWFLGRQIEGRFQVVDRGPLMLPTSPSRNAVRVAIECAAAPDEGGDYVALSVDGRPVSVETGLGRLDIPAGPYGRAGLYVASDRGTASALFDDLLVHVGDVFMRAPADRDPGLPSE